jgi:nucleotide-binding universal stress UspA family protein
MDEMRRNTGVKAHIHVEQGGIVETIKAAADRLQADLLVIGRSSESGTFGRLTANSYAIIRQAPCAVISV